MGDGEHLQGAMIGRIRRWSLRQGEDGLLHLDRRELAAIFAGGFLGALARGLLARAFPYSAHQWPWVTFAVNVLGAAVLGYVVTRLQERMPLSAYRRPLLGTGFCGAFTTFSTMQLELVRMLDVRDYALAASYLAASVCLGYVAVHLATALTRRARIVP
jgi:CrcB protein